MINGKFVTRLHKAFSTACTKSHEIVKEKLSGVILWNVKIEHSTSHKTWIALSYVIRNTVLTHKPGILFH
jgi:hypothetical protein